MHGLLLQFKRCIFTSSNIISVIRCSPAGYNIKFRSRNSIQWEKLARMGSQAVDAKIQSERSSNSASFDPDKALIDQLAMKNVDVPSKTMLSMDTALPFEQIPGPGIFKLWEKYWKYVPLLGRLNWNRNVTPLKYFFTKYGAVVRINGPILGNVIMIQRLDHIAQVLEQEGDAPIRSGIDILDHYRLHHKKYRLTGPFSMESADWLRLREKFNDSFNQIISCHFNRIALISNEVSNQIRMIRNIQDEVPMNFHDTLLRWELECFCSLILNRSMGFLEANSSNPISELSKTIEALNTAHKYMSICESGFQVWRFFDTPFSKKLFAACDVLDELITKCMVQIQCELNRQSQYLVDDDASPILGKLLLNQNLQLDDVSTILLDMMIMGVLAVTNTVAFLLYFIAKNPRIQKVLFNEIVSVSNGRSITDRDLKSMRYLRACLQECLRLRPAFPFMTRVLPKAIILHGYTVPAGTHVIMASELAARKEENFENPDKFDPSRWLTDQTINDDPLQEFSCLSFGYGLRSCVGRVMAETQIMMLIAQLVREFHIEYDYADIGSRFMMVNVPNKPLRFRFVDRK